MKSSGMLSCQGVKFNYLPNLTRWTLQKEARAGVDEAIENEEYAINLLSLFANTLNSDVSKQGRNSASSAVWETFKQDAACCWKSSCAPRTRLARGVHAVWAPTSGCQHAIDELLQDKVCTPDRAPVLSPCPGPLSASASFGCSDIWRVLPRLPGLQLPWWSRGNYCSINSSQPLPSVWRDRYLQDVGARICQSDKAWRCDKRWHTRPLAGWYSVEFSSFLHQVFLLFYQTCHKSYPLSSHPLTPHPTFPPDQSISRYTIPSSTSKDKATSIIKLSSSISRGTLKLETVRYQTEKK